MNLTVYAIGAGATVALLALAHRTRHGGAGDDHTTASGRTYGASPEPDDGGPELDRPLWRDHLDLDERFDERRPPGTKPRPARTEQEPE